MEIKQIKKNKTVILNVEGRIDSSTSGVLEKKILTILEEGEKNLIMDFTCMDYISSAGLRVLLMAAKRASKIGGEVVLCGLDINVKEVFDISGFTGIFSIFSSQEEALEKFQ